MIGALRHRVTLKGAPTVTQGAGGTLTETDSILGTVHAKIEPLSAREVFEAQKLDYPVTHRITTRYRAAWKAARFITFGARQFKVQSARDRDERGRWLEFEAQEGGIQ